MVNIMTQQNAYKILELFMQQLLNGGLYMYTGNNLLPSDSLLIEHVHLFHKQFYNAS